MTKPLDYPLNILVYNGDADGVCNFLGDEWFVEDLGLDVVSERHAWYYRQASSYVPTAAGYIKKFRKGSVNIDLLTVKVSERNDVLSRLSDI